MEQKHNIETGVAAMLLNVCTDVADGAGLAVLRGPVGIGKSYALARIAEELESDGVTVVLVTATETIAGQINAFLREILSHYHTDTSSSADAEEAVWQQLIGRPFAPGGRKVVLIIDEANKLAGRVLETIRGLYDRGDAARLGDRNAPAFGCVMVGNPTFLGKGGAQRVASFEPLLDRLTHNIRLPGPNRAECTSFATSLFDDAELASELVAFGLAKGNLRSMSIAARSAKQHAGDVPVTLPLLRKTIKMMGGR
ncbi:MAG: ATP-binding protein [Loktanella sp.]|nr:ATP-binding protein [Loktanella sp.]